MFQSTTEDTMKLVLYMVIVSGMLAGGQILLKTGLDRVGGFAGAGSIIEKLFRIFANGYILGGIAMIASQMLLWFWILSKYDLTKAYPLISMSYIFALVFAFQLIFLRPKVQETYEQKAEEAIEEIEEETVEEIASERKEPLDLKAAEGFEEDALPF